MVAEQWRSTPCRLQVGLASVQIRLGPRWMLESSVGILATILVLVKCELSVQCVFHCDHGSPHSFTLDPALMETRSVFDARCGEPSEGFRVLAGDCTFLNNPANDPSLCSAATSRFAGVSCRKCGLYHIISVSVMW